MALLFAAILSLTLHAIPANAQGSVGPGQNVTQCHFPDWKSIDEVSKTCGGDSGLCCPPGSSCLSNGVCESGTADNPSYVRASCTDWVHNECPIFCRGTTVGGAPIIAGQEVVDSAAVTLQRCPNSHYCCQAATASASACCGVADSATVNVQYIMTAGASGVVTVAPATSVGTVSGTSTSSPSSSTASVIASETSPAASSTESPGATTSSKGLSKGAIAGIAVGAVALVAIIAIVAFLLWRRRRKNYKAVRSPTETQQLKRDMGMESMAPIGAGIGAGAAAGAGGIAAHQWRDNRAMDSHNDMGHHDHDHDDEAEAGMTEMKPPERITEHPVDSMDSVASASRQRDIQDAADRELEEEGIRPFSPEDLEHGRDSPATGLMESRDRDVSPER